MNYADIKKVEEVYNVKDVNKYLDLGWILLNIYITAYDTQPPGSNHQSANYVLGWNASDEPKYPKEPTYGTYI